VNLEWAEFGFSVWFYADLPPLTEFFSQPETHQ